MLGHITPMYPLAPGDSIVKGDQAVPSTPEQSEELARRIWMVRRDIGGLLFHFTRTPPHPVEFELEWGGVNLGRSAGAVLTKILSEGRLCGTSEWSNGEDCVCFTESPIQELNAVFSLANLAATEAERPRYEPYGIAVTKEWLFCQGGRPVIYDDPGSLADLPERIKYRFVPYDPGEGLDYTWEREWRVPTKSLVLDPNHTLVVVPSADEAFQYVYDFAEMVPDYDNEPTPVGAYLAAVYRGFFVRYAVAGI